MTRVAGYCPMGCGQTLFLGDGGYVTCSFATCPNPGAVSDVLADSEVEHVVHLYRQTFTIKHPLRERLNNELLECALANWIARQGRPPRPPGVYRVTKTGESGKKAYHFERMGDGT